MNLYETATSLYRKYCKSTTLEQDIAKYARDGEGRVHITPELILIGRRIATGWYIHLAVSRDIRQLLRYLPYHLPHIGWCRPSRGRRVVVWHQTDRLLKHLTHEKNRKSNRKFISIPMPTEVRPAVWSGRRPKSSKTTRSTVNRHRRGRRKEGTDGEAPQGIPVHHPGRAVPGRAESSGS